MHVTWLGEPGSFDEHLVGGKSASLGRLAASFRVPPGFCIDATAHQRLGGALDGDARARSEIYELIDLSYRDLERRVGQSAPRVAVRSSAIGEDSRDASFAGQYETVLNVSGAQAIVEAVLHCWRSLSSERALAYRRARGIETVPRIAVLVQEMVDPDVSAIAFSADPVSGARDVVIINATPGLGDAIAAGTITPESFTVRKDDLAIVSRSAATANRSTTTRSSRSLVWRRSSSTPRARRSTSSARSRVASPTCCSAGRSRRGLRTNSRWPGTTPMTRD
jgi:pyruvate,water dikinase